ncbi:MAG: nucleoside triphosphate pyrophosphohydrolase [Deltaproteobacteria bacterium]|nr:nucleoside triphosphate pyrophosphohydrolase [Deltaproteobacteria bacterium]
MDRFEQAGAVFTKLCRIMARLRAPGGCPWDREQTPTSLKPYIIEEAYETIDAIDSGNTASWCEELGDLLLQVVFQAELAQEDAKFDIAAVVDGIADKLLRRHPHVFGDNKAKDADGALQRWEAVKAKERPKDKGVLAGVPRNLPALLRATRTGEKAGAAGFDWSNASEVATKVNEEWAELQQALTLNDKNAVTDEFGDLLFTMVNLSRRLGVDAETALQQATNKFQSRFEHMEQELRQQGRSPRDAKLEELEKLWQQAKKAVKKN